MMNSSYPLSVAVGVGQLDTKCRLAIDRHIRQNLFIGGRKLERNRLPISEHDLAAGNG